MENCGNLVRFENPEIVANMPELAYESQVLGKARVGWVGGEMQILTSPNPSLVRRGMKIEGAEKYCSP